MISGGTDTFDIATGGADTLVFQQFDSSLGILTSVDFFVEVNTRGPGYNFDNENRVGSLASYRIYSSGSFTASNVALSYNHTDGFRTSFANIAGDNDGAPDFEGSDSFFGGLGAKQSMLTGSATDVTPYIGVGNVEMNLDSSFGGDALLQVNFMPFASSLHLPSLGNVSGQVEVVYTYDLAPLNASVPEPSAVVVWSLFGCLGLAVDRRRRTRQLR